MEGLEKITDEKLKEAIAFEISQFLIENKVEILKRAKKRLDQLKEKTTEDEEKLS